MKKIVLLAAAILPFWSCSSDDDQPQPQAPTGTIPLVTKITTTDVGDDTSAIVYTFSYDENHRVKDIVVSGTSSGTSHYTYTLDGLIHTVSNTASSNSLFSTNYDAFLHLTQIASGSNSIPVTYDPVTNYYDLGAYGLTLADNGDVRKYGTANINYDVTKKGPFCNSHSNYQLLSLYTNNMFLYFAGQYAMTEWVNNNIVVVQFDNTYNSEGYVTLCHVSGFINLNVTFGYSKV